MTSIQSGIHDNHSRVQLANFSKRRSRKVLICRLFPPIFGSMHLKSLRKSYFQNLEMVAEKGKSLQDAEA